VVVYILIVAVLNLGLGFAISWHLGRRYRLMVVMAAEAAIAAGDATDRQTLRPESRSDEDSSAVCTDDISGAETAAMNEAEEEDETDEQDTSEEQGFIEAQRSSDADPQSEDRRDPDDPPAERFLKEVEQYHQQLTRLDNALRDAGESPEADVVRCCANSLREVNSDYRAAREEARQEFRQSGLSQEALQTIHEELASLVVRQDAQIDETDGVVPTIDYEADPDAGRRQVAHQTGKLLEVNHSLRDKLSQVPVVAARHEGRLRSIDPSKLIDPLTELSNRAGLEACLADWWEKDPHRVRQLNAAMIDLDEFGRVNERHGQETGDRVLRATARIVTSESRNHLLAARYSGQRFMLLFPDVDLRFATNLVERIRQVIELTKLKHRGEEIRVTVSCAATEIAREDTPESIYARAEATLHEAKRYGRNRTFLFEGKYPTPVVPPNFSLDERSVTL
jgi:diguanylate cyclase (GGDEF)-like protein